MKTITVVEINDISAFPPVQTLIEILLNKGYTVKFVGTNIERMPSRILDNPNFSGHELPMRPVRNTMLNKIRYQISIRYVLRNSVRKCMENSDVLWTTSMGTMRYLGKTVYKYVHVLELLELSKYGYSFRHVVRFPIDEYARRAKITVVPEINRAYIQQIWWELPQRPVVLPNKPLSIDYGDVASELLEAVQRIKQEKKKIALYLGGIHSDRSFDACAQLLDSMDDYVLYIVGKAFNQQGQRVLDRLVEKYHAVYLGSFDPPKHLALVKYAYLGLLPYRPTNETGWSELNALYCAPNKIFEYAGFGVPMVGSDVMGLRLPFEKWNIGQCCDIDDAISIRKAIEFVDAHHDEMSVNCYTFYDSVDLEKIVSEILKDE